MRFILLNLLVLGSFLGVQSKAQLPFDTAGVGAYLPPSPGDSNNAPAVVITSTATELVTETSFNVQTVRDEQVITVNMVATENQVVTTTMEQVEQREMVIPITSTFEVVATVAVTSVAMVPFTPPAVTSLIQSLEVLPTTEVVQKFETSTQVVESTLQNLETAYNTITKTQAIFSTVQETVVNTPAPVQSLVYDTQFTVLTETAQAPAVTSTAVVERIVEITSILDPVVNTNYVTQTQTSVAVSTAVENIANTQTEVATATTLVTSIAQAVETSILTKVSTSTAVNNQVITSTIQRVVQSTQVIPQVVETTRFVDDIQVQRVTQTQQSIVTDYTTVTGAARVVYETSIVQQNQVQIETRYQTNAIASTITSVVTAPCQQATQAGYNYAPPATPFNFK